MLIIIDFDEYIGFICYDVENWCCCVGLLIFYKVMIVGKVQEYLCENVLELVVMVVFVKFGMQFKVVIVYVNSFICVSKIGMVQEWLIFFVGDYLVGILIDNFIVEFLCEMLVKFVIGVVVVIL